MDPSAPPVPARSAPPEPVPQVRRCLHTVAIATEWVLDERTLSALSAEIMSATSVQVRRHSLHPREWLTFRVSDESDWLTERDRCWRTGGWGEHRM